jgi:hypothetical protein
MARRNWKQCACGAKLRVKSGEALCFTCKSRERREVKK